MKNLARLANRFFHQGDCCNHSQVAAPVPCVPQTGAIIADNAYFTLASGPQGQLLIVPLGSNTQQFLKQPGVSGPVWQGPDNQAYVEPAPKLNLPPINPPAGIVYPVPPGFPFLMIGAGGSPTAWGFVAAPTAGEYMLTAKAGQWLLADVGQIPGINEVGATSTFAAKGNVLSIVETSPGQFAVRKITVIQNSPLVGDIDGSGVTGFKALPQDQPLLHPKARFPDFQSRIYQGQNADGTPIVGGLETWLSHGASAVLTAERADYDPTTLRFYRRPPLCASFDAVTSSQTLNSPVAYQTMPAGHGVCTPQVHHFPRALILAQVSLQADEKVNFAVFRDGVQKHEWTFKKVDDSTLVWMDADVPVGVGHEYTIRWKRDAGAPGASVSCTIDYSNILVLSVP